MNAWTKAVLGWAFFAALAAGAGAAQEEEGKPAPKPDFPPIDETVKDAEKMEGFFNLYMKDGTLFMEVPSSMLEKPFLISDSLAEGFIYPGLIGWQGIYYWKSVDKRLFLMEEDVRHTAQQGQPIESAVESAYSDAVAAAVPVRAKSGGTFLIDLGDLLYSPPFEWATMLSSMGFGLDRNRTTWGAVKTYPQNVEIELDATYRGGGMGGMLGITSGGSGSGIPVTLRYSFSQIPNTGYKPRPADNRIGYFLSAKKDYSLKGAEEPFVRYINRWNLQKADPSADVSPPKKPIVFYIEKSVPYEYRPTVREGILEWNKAFEKAGIVNAIEVRYQEEDAEWDAEDVRYNTVRWMTTDVGVAIGPSRINPKTGEIYDADILVDAAWLQYYEFQYETLIDEAQIYWEEKNKKTADQPFSIDDFLEQWHEKHGARANGPHPHNIRRCSYGKGLQRQMAIAAAAAAVTDSATPEKKGQLQEFIRQGLKELIMHEVGHTLGLRHNFKSSAMLPFEKIHDKEYAENHGLGGSVMDYNLIVLAPEDKEQGYYYSPTLGEWDYLAIEYGYKDVPDAQLAAIAQIASTSKYLYGTDGDAGMGVDPLTTPYDMSNDTIAFAKERVGVIRGIWDGLVDNVVDKGEPYAKLREAFMFTLSDMQRSLYHTARLVGGYYVSRDHKGDPEESPNLEVVPAARQRAALEFVTETALTQDAFQLDPNLLSRLAPARWDHWGLSEGPIALPIHDYLLSGQMTIIRRLFSTSVLERVHDGQLYNKSGEDVFTLDEIYSTITGAVFSELRKEAGGTEWSGANPFIPSLRRDLQRAYLKDVLLEQVLNPSYGLPQDAQSFAWMAIQTLKRDLEALLEKIESGGAKLDPLSEAHVRESHLRIKKALDSGYTLNGGGMGGGVIYIY